eukprot:766390-Hanusia_phi.AAC.4
MGEECNGYSLCARTCFDSYISTNASLPCDIVFARSSLAKHGRWIIFGNIAMVPGGTNYLHAASNSPQRAGQLQKCAYMKSMGRVSSEREGNSFLIFCGSDVSMSNKANAL